MHNTLSHIRKKLLTRDSSKWLTSIPSGRTHNHPICIIWHFKSTNIETYKVHQAPTSSSHGWQWKYSQFHWQANDRRNIFFCPPDSQLQNHDSQWRYDEMWWEMWKCQTLDGRLPSQKPAIFHLYGSLWYSIGGKNRYALWDQSPCISRNYIFLTREGHVHLCQGI